MADKRVNVFQEDCDSNIPTTPTEFIEWWQDLFALVPEEFKATTKVEVEAEESYGCTDLTVTVSYIRPETEEEEDANRRKQASIVSSQRDRDLRTLAQLTAKYGEAK